MWNPPGAKADADFTPRAIKLKVTTKQADSQLGIPDPSGRSTSGNNRPGSPALPPVSWFLTRDLKPSILSRGDKPKLSFAVANPLLLYRL